MTVGGALRAAVRDLYENSWRLIVPNLVLSLVVLAALVATSYAQPAVLLLVAVGPFAAALMHCAVTVQQQRNLRLGDGLAGLRLHWRRGLALGALVAAAVVFGGVAISFYAGRGAVGWVLAVVAYYVVAIFAVWQIHVWPLAVARRGDDLRSVLRDAALGLARRPFATLAFAGALLLVNLVGAIGILPVLTITIAYSALAAAHFVLPPRPEEAPS